MAKPECLNPPFMCGDLLALKPKSDKNSPSLWLIHSGVTPIEPLS